MNKVSFKPLRQNLTLIVDLEERGMFYAHVEDQMGKRFLPTQTKVRMVGLMKTVFGSSIMGL